MFKKVDPKQSFPKMEEEILKFWEENKIFEKSVERNPEDKSFIFYEGPPTANGRPGLHHVLARAFKDVIPRYKTMKGYRVERKAGWDTHGLPVELQVEKSLGLKNKQEIENIVPGKTRESIIEFNKKCKESVWEYKDIWEKMTRRMAYWVDMEHPYITYENEYIESVWWVVAQVAKLKNEKGESFVYQGHKVVPYCYRCGTALSSHEVAQGYKKVKENSVYIKFKAKKDGKIITDDNTYFLAWTTTPWTLPGNVALALGPEINYALIKAGDIFLIAAKDKLSAIFPDNSYELIKEFNGQDLAGVEYEPLYETNNTGKKAYRIISGDFVTTEDGTGIVHIAPAFGEDDANVGKGNDLPTLITVDQEGKITADVPGQGIPVKKLNDKNKYAVDELILEDLKKRGLFFTEQEYEHDYPFCWRCGTPLIYYAKPSWFIRMSELSKELVENNEKINWVPEHFKKGRFGEWLVGIKDWAISRERYWGTPMPIWKCECGEVKFIESIDKIKKQLGNPNKLFLLRHGEADNNVLRILNGHDLGRCSLTEKGKLESKKAAKILKNEKIDLIFYSPFKRTKQTAEIISQQTGAEIIIDERLREFNGGKFEEKQWDEYVNKYPQLLNPGKTDENGVEGTQEIIERIRLFIDDINKKYQNKNIVVVSHGNIIRVLKGIISESSVEDILKDDIAKRAIIHSGYSKLFDLHKPFIDDVKLKCACGKEMARVPEVLDVWFDSGSMPLAQFYYPNQAMTEDKEKIESGKFFPADYICEAVDQTRGWFYTLHAIATLLNKAGKVPTGHAFKNVICLGHILDAKGKKMSKSLGNIVEPMEIIDNYGADMLRWMLYTINQPGLPKRFDIKGMKDIMNRVFRMLWNSYYFFVMYANIDKFKSQNSKVEINENANLLDKWVISELNVLIKNVDKKLEEYDIYGAGKEMEVFVDNLSNWYIRRSRKRFWKSENDTDKSQAYETLYYVLVNLAKLIAPFTPFIAEEIYKNLAGKEPARNASHSDAGGSVHLEDFPVAEDSLIDEKLNENMAKVRLIISEGLQKRAEAKIKVRQPLQKATIKTKVTNEMLDIIKEELNVKEVAVDEKLEGEVLLDTEITEDLKLEGMAREIIRAIQEMRKVAGYEVDNRIEVGYSGASPVFKKFRDMIIKEILADELKEGELAEADLKKELKIEGENIVVSIKK